MRFSTRSNTARGFTLIEAMAGLAIMGSVLVAVVVARDRYLQQSVAARHKAEAVKTADVLLTQWWDDPETLPRSGSGEADGFRWETRTRQAEGLTDLNAEILALSLTPLSDSDIILDDGSSGSPALNVEIVIPKMPEPDEEQTDDPA